MGDTCATYHIISLDKWLENWDNGVYNSRDVETMIKAGWYDWFCSDTSLYSRLKSMVPKIKFIVELEIIDCEKVYVFFKNNCPLVGNTYDDFRICDLYKEDVIFTVVPKSGHKPYNAELWGEKDPQFGLIHQCASWRNMKHYLKNNKEYLIRLFDSYCTKKLLCVNRIKTL